MYLTLESASEYLIRDRVEQVISRHEKEWASWLEENHPKQKITIERLPACNVFSPHIVLRNHDGFNDSFLMQLGTRQQQMAVANHPQYSIANALGAAVASQLSILPFGGK